MLSAKFRLDLTWNYFSLAIMAASGILINILIASYLGPKALGIFNQIYTVYVIASQFSVLGIHYSAQVTATRYQQEPSLKSQASWSAFIAVSIPSIVSGLIIISISDLLGEILESPPVGEGIAFTTPGIIFFAFNKVLLGILNGLRMMRLFAIGQVLRYLFMMSFVLFVIYFNLSHSWLGLTFSVAEFILILFLFPATLRQLPFSKTAFAFRRIKHHLSFGTKGFLSGLIMEVNPRVDILMLGMFLNDHAVGIYSFASMLAEGFYNMLIVIRNNINPLLARMLTDKSLDELLSMVHRLQSFIYPALTLLSILLLFIFKLGIHFFAQYAIFSPSWFILTILLAGITACGGYIPFGFILLQAGQPGYNTLFNVFMLGANILLNISLIPWWGIQGAAAATSISLVMSAFLLRWLARNRLSLSLPNPAIIFVSSFSHLYTYYRGYRDKKIDTR